MDTMVQTQKRAEYCVRNKANCLTCGLSADGLDCRNIPIHFSGYFGCSRSEYCMMSRTDCAGCDLSTNYADCRGIPIERE